MELVLRRKIIYEAKQLQPSDNFVKSPSDWVVNGPLGEVYVISHSQAESNYDMSSGTDVTISDCTNAEEMHRLNKEGYKAFTSNRKILGYKVTQKDIDWLSNKDINSDGNLTHTEFVAPWGNSSIKKNKP